MIIQNYINTRILIIGSGNIGTYFACQFSSKGFKTAIYSSKSELIKDELNVVDENEDVIISSHDIYTITSLEEVKKYDMLLITYPPFMFEDLSKRIEPYIRKGMYIGVIPGTGACEYMFKNCIDKGAILFGIQRVPAVSRLKEYGKCVKIEGKRKTLHLSSVPIEYSNDLATLFENVFDMECIPLPYYLCITLTPSNPILHTTRLYSMFIDYYNGKKYENNPLFYKEWNDESSKMLIACDNELHELINKLEKLDLSSVRPLLEHYESNNYKELTKKIQSIKSLSNIYSPMIKVDGGYVPDFSSRYFTADFPYGLHIIKQFCDLLDVNAPNINKVLSWYETITGNTSTFSLDKYGIYSIEDVYNYYK